MPPTPATMTQAASDLVQRSRQGDQNAISVLCLLREQAAKGVAKARSAVKLCMDYIKAHPVGQDEIGEEQEEIPRGLLRPIFSESPTEVFETILKSRNYKNGVAACTVFLANYKPLSDNTVSVMGDAFGTEAEREFFFCGIAQPAGFKERFPGRAEAILLIGRVIGQARIIQSIRRGTCSISQLCPNVAWELGEA